MTRILAKLFCSLWLLLAPAALAVPDFQLANSTNGLTFALQSGTNQLYLIQSVDHLGAEGWVITSNSVYYQSNNWQPDRLLQTGTNGYGETAFTVPNQGSGFYRATAFTGAVARVTFAPAVTPLKLLDPLNYTWIFTNTTFGLEQLIRLRAPGAHPTNAVILGSSPPGTDLFYLRADGTWLTNEVVYTNAGFGGTISGQPPLYREGLWQFEFILRDPATGDIVEYDTKSFLVGSSPRIFLHVSRPIANGDDPVKASVDLAAGFSTANVKLLAWLAQPDGSTVSLPWFLPGLDAAYIGAATNRTFDLFHREFPTNGQYRVEARLMDADSGATLGVGSVPFSVCDSSNLVSGQLRDTNGVALANTADISQVRALDIDDLTEVTASPDSAGNYSFSLPAGRYLLGATFWNSTGFYESFTNLTRLVVDCGSTNPVINLALSQLSTNGIAATPHLHKVNDGPQPTEGGGLITSFANASDACRQPTIYIAEPSFSNEPQVDRVGRTLMAGIMANALAATGDVEVHSLVGLRMLQIHFAIDQLMARDEIDTPTETIGDYLGTDFLLAMSIGHVGATKLIFATIIDQANYITARRVYVPYDASTDDNLRATMTALADKLINNGPGINLLADLRAAQPLVFPTNSLALSKDTVVLNEPITITASVRDTCGDTPVPDQKVEISDKNASDGGGETVLATLTTGNDGKATTQFTPTSYGLFKIKADFHRSVSPTAALRVWDTNGIQMTSAKVHLSYGESAVIAVHLPSLKNAPANQPPPVKLQETFTATQPLTPLYVTNIAASSIYVSNAPDGSLYVNPSNQVDFAVSYTAPNQAGMAELTAARRDAGNGGTNNSSGLINFIVDSGVETSLTATPKSVFGGYPSKLTLDALINGVRLAGLPVTYTLTGNGTLETNAAVTDAYGQAVVLYTAPTNATGSATISAFLSANGTVTSNSVTVSYSPFVACQSTNNAPYCVDVIYITTNNVYLSIFSDAGVAFTEFLPGDGTTNNFSTRIYKNGVWRNPGLSPNAYVIDMNDNGDLLYYDGLFNTLIDGVSNAAPSNQAQGVDWQKILNDKTLFGSGPIPSQAYYGGIYLKNGIISPAYSIGDSGSIYLVNRSGTRAFTRDHVVGTAANQYCDSDRPPCIMAPPVNILESDLFVSPIGVGGAPGPKIGYYFPPTSFDFQTDTHDDVNFYFELISISPGGDVLLGQYAYSHDNYYAHPFQKFRLVKSSGVILEIPMPAGFNSGQQSIGPSIILPDGSIMVSIFNHSNNSNIPDSGDMMIYRNGQWQTLSSLLGGNIIFSASDPHVDSACFINSRGEIMIATYTAIGRVGYSYNNVTFRLLTPTGK